MHKFGWKEKLFDSADVSMLGHGCGVSQYPQFHDRIKKKSNITTSIYEKLFRLKGSPTFSRTMNSLISQIRLDIFYGFNK